jgi:membrane glycosyltransferase
MLFHANFVVRALAGNVLRWKSPPRDDAETSWGDALRYHALQTLIGFAWIVGIYALDPAYIPWLLPVGGALILAIPLSSLTSRVSLGRRLARARLFLIPEETNPPPETRAVCSVVERAPAPMNFRDAVVDPIVNATACLAAVHHPRLPAAARAERRDLGNAALKLGPEALNSDQKTRLLEDPCALAQLHFAVWTAPSAIAASWRCTA